MLRNLMLCATSLVLVGTAATAEAEAPQLSGTVKTIDGDTVNLDQYAGKVVLAVNVASRCGFTRQYAGLQKLYDTYREKGFVVLGFPCNQFAGQEPEGEADIKKFCQTEFGVTFPMFAKVEVNGDDALPLYKFLTSDEASVEDAGPVKWNFEKFLFDSEGKVIARYRSAIEPDDPKLIAAIETALESVSAP